MLSLRNSIQLENYYGPHIVVIIQKGKVFVLMPNSMFLLLVNVTLVVILQLQAHIRLLQGIMEQILLRNSLVQVSLSGVPILRGIILTMFPQFVLIFPEIYLSLGPLPAQPG